MHLTKKIVLVLVALAIALGGGLAIRTAVRARPTLVVVHRGPTYPAADVPETNSSSDVAFMQCRGFDDSVGLDRCQPVAIEYAEDVQPRNGAPGLPIVTGGSAPPMRDRERLLVGGGGLAVGLGIGLLSAFAGFRRRD